MSENELDFECSLVDAEMIFDPTGKVDNEGNILQIPTGVVLIECESDDQSKN